MNGGTQILTHCEALRAAFDILGITPVHDVKDLQTVDSRGDLWSEQIKLKKQGKYEVEDGIWDRREQWDQVLGDYAAVVDFPGYWFVAELARAYPEAKFVLTVRDSAEKWLESYSDSVHDRRVRRHVSMSYQIVHFVQRLLGQEDNQQKAANAAEYGDSQDLKPEKWWYTEHNQHVRKYVPPDRLLEFNLKQGWKPLCHFLGKEVPAVSFPHVNDRQYYSQETAELIKSADERLGQLLRIASGTVFALILGIMLYRRYLRRAIKAS